MADLLRALRSLGGALWELSAALIVFGCVVYVSVLVIGGL